MTSFAAATCRCRLRADFCDQERSIDTDWWCAKARRGRLVEALEVHLVTIMPLACLHRTRTRFSRAHNNSQKLPSAPPEPPNRGINCVIICLLAPAVAESTTAATAAKRTDSRPSRTPPGPLLHSSERVDKVERLSLAAGLASPPRGAFPLRV